VLFRGKVYMCQKDIQLRREIVQLHHDTPVAGHPGRWKTLGNGHTELLVARGSPNLCLITWTDVTSASGTRTSHSHLQAGSCQFGTPVEPWKAIFSGLHCRTPRSPRDTMHSSWWLIEPRNRHNMIPTNS